MADKEKFNVAIVSANWGVTSHLPAWRVLPEVEVIGICTSREDTARAAAQKNDIPRAYWNIDDVCADPAIDIVDCGTRPDIRVSLVEKILQAGKHCYSAVPFATDGAAARRLRDLQAEKGVVGMVDTPMQAIPVVLRMKELIDQGFVGEIWEVNSYWNMQFMMHPHALWPYKWFAHGDIGVSAIRNLGSHALNTMVSLIGRIAEVVALGDIFLKEWRYSDGTTAIPHNIDTGSMLLRFANGAQGSFQSSWVAADGPGWALEIFGSKGRLRAESPAYPTAETSRLYAGTAGTSNEPQGEWLDLPERLLSLHDSLLDPAQADTPAAKKRKKGPQDLVNARLYRGMVEAIREGRDASPGFAQACHVQLALDAAHRSIENHRWEVIED